MIRSVGMRFGSQEPDRLNVNRVISLAFKEIDRGAYSVRFQKMPDTPAARAAKKTEFSLTRSPRKKLQHRVRVCAGQPLALCHRVFLPGNQSALLSRFYGRSGHRGVISLMP